MQTFEATRSQAWTNIASFFHTPYRGGLFPRQPLFIYLASIFFEVHPRQVIIQQVPIPKFGILSIQDN